MNVQESLVKIKNEIGRLLPDEFYESPPLILDLSPNNQELKQLGVTKIDPATMSVLGNYIDERMRQHKTKVAIGKYNEQRLGYDTILFTNQEEPRTIHLGIDVFVPSGTPLRSPLNGKVHSFKFNDRPLDYGPAIILVHEIEGVEFYTLYGHLSLDSIENLKVGQEIVKGTTFARVGTRPTNGDWHPHVHFEIITDLMGLEGDFPGVAALSQREKYLNLCPNPNLILNFTYTH